MSLNEELTNLYKVANDKKAKSKEFLEHTLPDRLRACANKGFNCYTIPLAEIEVNGLTLYDIRSWCFENGLFCDPVTSLSGEYVSIYWAIHRE